MVDFAQALSGQLPKRSGAQTIGRALSGLSAGIQGQGPQYLQSLAVQDQAAAQEQKALSAERLKAMAIDAQRVDSLLKSGDIQGALRVIDNRTAAIRQLGGDASDTLRIRQQIMSGQIPAAQAEIGQFLQAAQQYGLIPSPQIIPQSAVSPTGQVAMQQPGGGMSMQNIPGFQAPAASQESKVVGDYLVDAASGEILFDAMSQGGAGGAEHGLTPLIFRDPATGKYAPYLPTKQGTMTALAIPQGQEFVPDAARMGYNPANIAERGGAEAQTALANAPTLGQAERQQQTAATQGTRMGALESKEAQFKLLDEIINEVRGQAGQFTTGILGAATRGIPGTPSANLSKNLDTLVAAAGFDKLQEMRNNSPTGGALGAVTERELALLQSTWGSLSQSQGEEQFKRNLDRFQRQIKESWDRVSQAYERDFGQPYYGGAAPAAQAAIPAGAVLKFDANGDPL